MELLRQEALARTEDPYKMSTEVKDYVPSVDLRDFLQLYAPSETYVHLTPCHTCGGTLEILHFDVRIPAQSNECLRVRVSSILNMFALFGVYVCSFPPEQKDRISDK